ncbi:MAG: 3-oxoacyl-ACP reductase FabG [Acidobacteria bacterium]|nr:3-oxoacyl-ACP reductase FabG [Acidobacteriota bacterium]
MSTVLVTGGSRGIGRAIVEEFGRVGHAVAFTYVQNRESAEAQVASLMENGTRAVAYQADVRDFQRAQEVVKQVQELLGPVEVLVNNAGIRRDRALLNMDPAVWQEVIETNLTGTFNYSRSIIPDLIRRGGVILNIASVSGMMGIAGQTNYSASKAGIIGFTKALSREVARLGVRVNAIVPGAIETDMTISMEESARRKLYAQIPSGRPGCAQQVARLALYLASQDATYITGQVFVIDGGLT